MWRSRFPKLQGLKSNWASPRLTCSASSLIHKVQKSFLLKPPHIGTNILAKPDFRLQNELFFLPVDSSCLTQTFLGEKLIQVIQCRMYIYPAR